MNMIAIDTSIFESAPFPVWVINKSDLKIIFANSVSATLLGKHCLDQHLDTIIYPDESYSDQFKNIDIKPLNNIFINFNLNHHAIQQRINESGSSFFQRFSLNSTPTKEHIIVFLKKREGVLISLLTSILQDFLILLNDDDTIREVVTTNLTAELQQPSLVLTGHPISALLSPLDAIEINHRVKSAEKHMTSLSDAAYEKWSTVYSDDFSNPMSWYINKTFESYWKFEQQTGVKAVISGSAGYLHSRFVPDIRERDLAISVKIDMSAKVRFAILFCADEPSPWTTKGYSAGIRDFNGKTYLTLKKNAGHVAYHQIDIMPVGQFEFRIEKSGGLISFFINGKIEFSYSDLTPLSDDFPYFGLLATAPISFKEVVVQTRTSSYNPNLAYKPLRLSVPGIESHIYEVHPYFIEEWDIKGPQIAKGLLLKDVTQLARLEADVDTAKAAQEALFSKNYYGFVGSNPAILKVINLTEKIAPTNATVLILGPTGSGKDVLANAIHLRSNRANKPFIKVDCAALPQNLIESELFGHEKGAFTGASTRQTGKLEAADGGTLFLDEVGNIPLEVQAKLLNFLENKKISRVGSTALLQLDVRIILATNSNLTDAVKNSLFREDLYYRINGITIELPFLRDRVDDIPALCEYFVAKINKEHKLAITGISRRILDTFLLNKWTGNVRELYNTILKLAILQRNGEIDSNLELKTDKTAATISKTYLPDHIREEKILELLNSKPYFSSKDCLKQIPVSLPTIRRDLRRLTAEGKILAVGKGPSTRYFSKGVT
ncbi:MAG: sigma 54-interacting transcriptional regulator [Fibrobacteres bacterium]|nr:sigma 54-interacting transcriptional regulator [Fibrobacterota bacterium]